MGIVTDLNYAQNRNNFNVAGMVIKISTYDFYIDEIIKKMNSASRA